VAAVGNLSLQGYPDVVFFKSAQMSTSYSVINNKKVLHLIINLRPPVVIIIIGEQFRKRMQNSHGEPPPSNPALQAYEQFSQSTPFVTRTILIVQAVSYIVSWFFDPHYALGNIPHFSILRFEIYRILLSPLVNSSLFALILAFWSFQDHGKRLEQSLGSTSFAWLCLMMGTLTNLLFIAVSFTLYVLFGKTSFLFQDSSGIWIILFGTLSMECVRAPRGSTRRLFVVDVPVLYFPFSLYLLFVLMGQGLLMGQGISLGLGYALGFASNGEDTSAIGQKLDRYLLIDSVTAKAWEDKYLNDWTNRPGWISGHAAAGSGAWNETDAVGMVGLRRSIIDVFFVSYYDSENLFLQRLPLFGQSRSVEDGHENSISSSSSTTNNPVGPGRTLGGATRRGTTSAAEARQARLLALEKRAQESNNL
jgi:membrane associated rhomboid family serine protease